MPLTINSPMVRRRLRFTVRNLEVFDGALLLSQAPPTQSPAGRGRQLFVARSLQRLRRCTRRRMRVYLDVSDPRYATWDEGVQSLRLSADRLLVRFLPDCGTVPWCAAELALHGIDSARLKRHLEEICRGLIPLFEGPSRRLG